ncbi:MAG: hypothetical protein R3F61_00290 [Myxococcota bacterium]
MEIRVLGVIDAGPPARVRFEPVRSGSVCEAEWVGAAPEVGSRAHVELDVPEVCPADLAPAIEPEGLRASGERLEITGTLEVPGSSGCAALRVHGSLVLLDLPEGLPAGLDGTQVTLTARAVRLFPFTL